MRIYIATKERFNRYHTWNEYPAGYRIKRSSKNLLIFVNAVITEKLHLANRATGFKLSSAVTVKGYKQNRVYENTDYKYNR